MGFARRGKLAGHHGEPLIGFPFRGSLPHL
ncbi:hypothetical protein DHODJN_02415 [Methylorubrum extorquens]